MNKICGRTDEQNDCRVKFRSQLKRLPILKIILMILITVTFVLLLLQEVGCAHRENNWYSLTAGIWTFIEKEQQKRKKYKWNGAMRNIGYKKTYILFHQILGILFGEGHGSHVGGLGDHPVWTDRLPRHGGQDPGLGGWYPDHAGRPDRQDTDHERLSVHQALWERNQGRVFNIQQSFSIYSAWAL